ncbi:MAG: hypothetical protein R3B47_02825 [Bacteroidia bacterium]
MKKLPFFLLIIFCLNASAQSDSSFSSPFLGDVPFVEVRSYELNQYGGEYRQLADWVYDRFEKKRESGMPFDSLIFELELFGELYMWSSVGEHPSIVVDSQIDYNAEQLSSLNTAQIRQLFFILDRKNFPIDPNVEPMPDLNCIPVYRDALVFFDKEKNIVGKIDICLGCRVIRVNGEYFSLANEEHWEAWEKFFEKELGHPTWRERHMRN